MLTEIVSPQDRRPVQAREAVGFQEPPVFAGGKLGPDRRLIGASVTVFLLFLADFALVVGGFMSGALS